MYSISKLHNMLLKIVLWLAYLLMLHCLLLPSQQMCSLHVKVLEQKLSHLTYSTEWLLFHQSNLH